MPDITAKWTSKTESCVKKLERQLCSKETGHNNWPEENNVPYEKLAKRCK